MGESKVKIMIRLDHNDIGLLAGLAALIAGVIAGITALLIAGAVLAGISLVFGVMKANRRRRERAARAAERRAQQQTAFDQNVRDL